MGQEFAINTTKAVPFRGKLSHNVIKCVFLPTVYSICGRVKEWADDVWSCVTVSLAY